jgi:predicted nuclease of predicted toxin-antitoxin system
VRILIDENLSSQRLAARLEAMGHDVVLVDDVGLLSASDARVLTWAIGQDRSVLTRDTEDFEELHDLVLASESHHPGMLFVRFDRNPRHNMTEQGIAIAVGKLDASGVPIPNLIHVLNHWR